MFLPPILYLDQMTLSKSALKDDFSYEVTS